jgi:hypothetical protein
VNLSSPPVRRRDLGDVDLRLAERADLLGLDGLEVEAREGVVDGLLDDRAAAEALVDDARRHLALAEARDGRGGGGGGS